MVAPIQWSYAQRESISWTMGLLMGLAILWGFGNWQATAAPSPLTEMVAMLDMPAPQIVQAVQQIQPSAPRPATTVRQTLPISAPVSATPQQGSSPAEAPTRAAESTSVAPLAATATVTAPPVQASTEPVRSSVTVTYEAQLLAYLERIKRYPTSREARLSQPQGVTKLWLEISRTGALISTGLLQSSGSNLLDSEALRTVRTAQFPAFPEQAFGGESSHRFSVSLKYQIEGQ
ncbi:MAG: TonB family protein [Limnohabitans sp.]